jgi:hypothetical protein
MLMGERNRCCKGMADEDIGEEKRGWDGMEESSMPNEEFVQRVGAEN